MDAGTSMNWQGDPAHHPQNGQDKPQMSPDGAEDSMMESAPPPPPYYQVMQQQNQTVYRPEEPRFTFIDFYPDGHGDRYPDLVDKANYWIAQNRQFMLQSCETISVSLKQGVPNHGSSLQHTPSGSYREFTKVLRCWIVRVDSPSENPQVLRTLAHMPTKTPSLTITFSSPYYQNQSGAVPSFGNLTQCLAKLNEQLDEKPIPGEILRVETSSILVTQAGSTQVNTDPDVLYWTDGNMQSIYCNYIRLFYIEGHPAQETIGWHDVVPGYQHNRAAPHRPKFETFTQTTYRAGHWAYTQQDKRITNIQTCSTKVTMDPLFPISARRPVIKTDTSEWTNSKMMGLMNNGPSAQFLRIYWTQPAAGVHLAKPYQLFARSFIPYKVTNRQFETPADNIRRLGTWISFNQSYGLRDSDIMCVESVQYPIANPSSRIPVDAEKMSDNTVSVSGGHKLVAVRVYTNGVFNEPPVQFMNIPVAVYTQDESECCSIS